MAPSSAAAALRLFSMAKIGSVLELLCESKSMPWRFVCARGLSRPFAKLVFYALDSWTSQDL
jgi:hypothetical protein